MIKQRIKQNSSIYIVKAISDLIPGDIALHPIYREDGLLLVNKYTVLTSLLIKQIHVHLKENVQAIVSESKENFSRFIVNKVYTSIEFIDRLRDIVESMKDAYNIPIFIESFVDERIDRALLIKDSSDIKENIENTYYNATINKMTSIPLWQSLDLILESERLQAKGRSIKKQLMEDIFINKEILDNINKMNDYDDLLLIHGANVMCISILIGLTLEISELEIMDLAISALFCNIGFIKVDKNEFKNFLLNQEDLAVISNHIRNSIEIISNSSFCRNKAIIYGIVDHHEYYNGKGYPARKAEKDISLFGRIIGLADYYDELVGGYNGKEALNAIMAMKLIWENKGKELDFDIIRIYVCRSNVFKIGQATAFNRNERGTIIGFSDFIDSPHKPIVKLENGMIKDYLIDDI